MKYTTKVQTANGAIYDLGEFEHPPKHDHLMTCPACLVVNAWTEPEDTEKMEPPAKTP